MNSAIPLSNRITTALRAPARKVDGFKALQVVAVLCCSVLRFEVCVFCWLGFSFFVVVFKNSIEVPFSSASEGSEGVLLEQ